MQSLLGIDGSSDKRTQACVEHLEELGYIVISPKKLDNSSVKNIEQLVDFFYSRLCYKHPDRNIHYSKSSKKDYRLASVFVKSRQEVCGNKAKALQECTSIIGCVIENEELFGFSDPLSSMAFFGQDNMKWVSDKAISIINGDNEHVEEEILKTMIVELDAAHEKEALEDINVRIDDLKEVLGGLKDG